MHNHTLFTWANKITLILHYEILVHSFLSYCWLGDTKGIWPLNIVLLASKGSAMEDFEGTGITWSNLGIIELLNKCCKSVSQSDCVTDVILSVSPDSCITNIHNYICSDGNWSWLSELFFSRQKCL